MLSLRNILNPKTIIVKNKSMEEHIPNSNHRMTVTDKYCVVILKIVKSKEIENQIIIIKTMEENEKLLFSALTFEVSKIFLMTHFYIGVFCQHVYLYTRRGY